MSASEIKERLHKYVDSGDEKLLKLMYAMAKEYNEEEDFDYSFSEEELKVVEERRQKRLNGSGKTYSWEEAKIITTGQKKP